jgi:hypothetical protein
MAQGLGDGDRPVSTDEDDLIRRDAEARELAGRGTG